MLNIALIRMYILMLGTCNVEQMKDARMYIEEFILVEIWIHCCTKLEVNTLENTLAYIQSQQWKRNVRIALRSQLTGDYSRELQ